MSLRAAVARRLRFQYVDLRWRLLRATRDTTTLRTRQGLLTVATRDDIIGRLLFAEGQYQHDVATRAVAHLRALGVLPPRSTGTIVDIGANIGLISIGLLLEGEFRDAIGIEPDPVNFALLEQNIAQNGLTGRYRSVKAAATTATSALRLGLSPDNFGDHRIGAAAHRVSIPVAGRPIDDIVAGADVSFVCIDTQGHEAAVLAGGRALFGAGVPTLAEIWPHALQQSERGAADLCALAGEYWGSFWVWRRCERYVQYPIAHLPKFCEELGTAEGQYDDVLFTRD